MDVARATLGLPGGYQAFTRQQLPGHAAIVRCWETVARKGLAGQHNSAKVKRQSIQSVQSV